VHNTGDTIAITLHVYAPTSGKARSVRPRSYELRNDTRAVGEGLRVFKDLAETLSRGSSKQPRSRPVALGVVYQPACNPAPRDPGPRTAQRIRGLAVLDGGQNRSASSPTATGRSPAG